MRIKYRKELEELGWKFNIIDSMKDYYVFNRRDERLYIDTDKLKITHYNFDEDGLPELSYETLKIIVEIFKNEIGE